MGNGFVILTAYVLACCGQNDMLHWAGPWRLGHNTIHTLYISRYKLWVMDL